MPGKQGQHMQRVWDERQAAKKSRESAVPEKKTPRITNDLVVDADDERILRNIILKKDIMLIESWFKEHPETLMGFFESISKEIPITCGEIMEITAKICCATDFVISHRTVKGYIRTLYERSKDAKT